MAVLCNVEKLPLVGRGAPPPSRDPLLPQSLDCERFEASLVSGIQKGLFGADLLRFGCNYLAFLSHKTQRSAEVDLC